MKNLMLVFFVALPQIVFGQFAPENDFAKYDVKSRMVDMTETEFNEIIDSIIDMWQPLAKARGAELVSQKNWASPTVNAYANQVGNTWQVAMFGGLARRREVTKDGFAIVVCHELGHHFAGYYFKKDRWAASEGESDYWATHVCAKEVFKKLHWKSRMTAKNRSPLAEGRCRAQYADVTEQESCVRASTAGLSLANLLAALGGAGNPSYETPDLSKVTETQTSHPAAQCRLDTYFYGALCRAAFDLTVIPGKNHPQGQNSKDAEGIAAQNSCMQAALYNDGFRPGCWFKAQEVQ